MCSLVWIGLVSCVFIPLSRALVVDTPEEVALCSTLLSVAFVNSNSIFEQLNIDQSEHKEFQATHDSQRNSQGHAVIRNDKHYTLREALGTCAFWILAYGFLQPAVVNSAIIFHAGSIASSHGMRRSAAKFRCLFFLPRIRYSFAIFSLHFWSLIAPFPRN